MLTRASLRYYAGTNALVVLGVAVAVAVLAGALLVGESVRESLRQIALARLGNVDAIVTAPTFFRTALAYDVAARSPSLMTSRNGRLVAWLFTASMICSGSFITCRPGESPAKRSFRTSQDVIR